MSYLIYGAGHFGQCFFNVLTAESEQVEGWIDERLAGTQKEGLPIFNEASAAQAHTVIVAVTPLIHTDRKNIKERLSSLGFNNVLSFFEAMKRFPAAMVEYAKLEHLWMRPDNTAHLPEIELNWLKARLSDEKSKHVLDKLCAFRKTYHLDDYPEPDTQEEYFPEDVPWLPKSPIKFLDCGAYTGDTMSSLLDLSEHKNFVVDSVISFEPDPKNFASLKQIISARTRSDLSLQAMPFGVWSHVDILSFNDGQTSSSSFSDDSEQAIHVSVVDLDSLFLGCNINYIKMDIEGAELSALRGSSQIIREQSPNLAICVYHKPEDLWKIPKIIDELQPNYDMYLRVHEHLGLSTVLYCINKEK
jgi:FkbM family methyltransferase